MSGRVLPTALTALLAIGAGPQERESGDAPPFTVPEGYVIERVAGPPLVERPIMASFDEDGRLYVSDSAGVNHPGKELLKDPPHKIRLLEDTDGDGVFDKSTVFADKLVFPQGLLWHDGAVFCVSPPSLWKLEDTDGDGVCDKRTELVSGFAVTGVADDAHGAMLGPDGRIYFLPGRMHHKIKTRDGALLRDAVGPWVMRCKPDGSDVEIVCGAVGNPVEMDWTPEGDFFVSGTFWAPDSFGGGLRDALIHGVEGGEWPVRDRVYRDRIRTGELLPVMVPMIASAPSGMMTYKNGGPLNGNLFCTYFNLNRVLRHVLTRDGATFKATSEDFAVGTNPDVHPTDVLEDADGSILVVDTGGWFRIGCPASVIAKPQVLGGIYRVRRKNARKIEDPWGRNVGWRSIGSIVPCHKLVDERPFVRQRAIRELAKWAAGATESDAVEVMGWNIDASEQTAFGALWVLSRVDAVWARKLVRDRIPDSSERISQVAIIVAGLHRDVEALPALVRIVKDRGQLPQVRREAAGAIGRIGRAEAVPALLEALRHEKDRYIEHALIYALVRIDEAAPVRAALADGPARQALIALDQMAHGDLKPVDVLPLLEATDPALRREAAGVAARRRAWAKDVAAVLRRWLGGASMTGERVETARGLIGAFKEDAEVQSVVGKAAAAPATAASVRFMLLEAMAESGLKGAPDSWIEPLRAALGSPEEELAWGAVRAVEALSIRSLDDELRALAAGGKYPRALRLAALRLLVGRGAPVGDGVFEWLMRQAQEEEETPERLEAIRAIGSAELSKNQLRKVAALVAGAGPVELPTLVAAFERGSADEQVGRTLVASLAKTSGLWSVNRERLQNLLARYPEPVRRDGAALLERLKVEDPATRIKQLEASLVEGDPAAGRTVFFGKAKCFTCHTVAGEGGVVGPELTHIGSIRQRRDLLEAIAFPSASFARGFEPMMVTLKNGGTRVGRIVRETPEEIELIDAEGKTSKVKRDDLFQIIPNRISVMPEGFDRVLTAKELSDLTAFLRSLQ
jgi:putative membrane-bound dehydrogenase-like protein